jgi:Skp family chaperone for outer membrane proteins
MRLATSCLASTPRDARRAPAVAQQAAGPGLVHPLASSGPPARPAARAGAATAPGSAAAAPAPGRPAPARAGHRHRGHPRGAAPLRRLQPGCARRSSAAAPGLNEDLQREQARWREEQGALAAARATLQPEQLRQRERELQDRITDAQRIFRDRSRSIDGAAQAGLQQIEQALGAVIRQVAASRGVNVVLPRALVIFNEQGFDLTDEVSAQMNRVLRTVNLPAEGVIPGETPAAPAPAAAAGQRPAAPAAQPPRRN